MQGATQLLRHGLRDNLVSIHAPVQGATRSEGAVLPVLEFQSTHPCRVRQTEVGVFTVAQLFQSTHPCRVRQLINNYLFFNNLPDVMREYVFWGYIIIRFIYLGILVT